MILTIDRGNTKDKYAVFDGNELKDVFVLSKDGFKELILQKNILKYDNMSYDISSCIYSDVSGKNKNFKEYFNEYFPTMEFTKDLNLSFLNGYKSPTIGSDRLCAVEGAKEIVGVNTLVIDAGTCITYDFLNKDNRYCGGSISPGIIMRYKAMNTFTANLPMTDEIRITDLCADTTLQGLVSGVINGVLAEVKGIIDRYISAFGKINIVFTGGNGQFLYRNLDCEAIYEPNLILLGLKKILEINERK